MRAVDGKIPCTESEVMMPVTRRGQARSTEIASVTVELWCCKLESPTGPQLVCGAPDGTVDELIKIAMKRYPAQVPTADVPGCSTDPQAIPEEDIVF